MRDGWRKHLLEKSFRGSADGFASSRSMSQRSISVDRDGVHFARTTSRARSERSDCDCMCCTAPGWRSQS